MIAGGAIGGAIAVGKAVQGGRDAPIKVAIVGCGRRGRELADAVMAVEQESVRLVGLADVLPSQTQSAYRSLKGRFKETVADDCLRSNGPECIDRILESEADVIFLTTPPVDRPGYFRKVVEAGKHVFMEKPLAADVAGVLDTVATAAHASENGLSVHVGFQRRYDARYQDVIARVREGAIGTVVFARAFCNAGPLRKPVRNRNETDFEFQRRNWNHYQWTGGDFLVEQHVAGLDALPCGGAPGPNVRHPHPAVVTRIAAGKSFVGHRLQTKSEKLPGAAVGFTLPATLRCLPRVAADSQR